MDNQVILVGGFHEMIELCEEAGKDIIGIIDGNLEDQYYGYPVIGSDENIGKLGVAFRKVPLLITPDSPVVRKKIFEFYSSSDFSFASVISPSAKVSKYAQIGRGVVIQSGVNISANVKLGNMIKCNTGSNIMHDSIVGDFCTIAPNAVILGRVEVGSLSYIGANATILPNLTVGDNVTIGAGSVVTRNVKDYKTVRGVPAK